MIRTPRCMPRGSRWRRSPETKASTPAWTAQARIRSSSVSPLTGSGGSSGAAISSLDSSRRSSSAPRHGSGPNPNFTVRIRSSSTIAGRARMSSRRPSIASSISLLGGPDAMKAETRTLVSQRTRRISGGRSGSRLPGLRCPPGRSPVTRRAGARSAAAPRSARPVPGGAGHRELPRSWSCPGSGRGRRSQRRGRQEGKRKAGDSYEDIISTFRLRPTGGDLHPLRGGCEEVAVDLGEAGQVVDVLVQVGDADDAAGPQLGREVVDVAGVALGQSLIVGEVVGDAFGEVGVGELLGQRLGQVLDLGAELVGGVVDLVDNDAAEGELGLDQLAMEVDRLVDRL